MIYTVNDLIQALQTLQAEGLGDREVHIMQYAGGDDKPCYVEPVKPADDGPVMLSTHWVRY